MLGTSTMTTGRGGPDGAHLLSPGYATLAMGISHGVWGLLAYRTGLRKIARAGYLDSVGDGLFRTKHSQDQRAAAFWFMFAAPTTALLGYLAEAAIQSGNRRAVATAGVGITALTVTGAAAIPRSGFPPAIALGLWMLHRASQLGGDLPASSPTFDPGRG